MEHWKGGGLITSPFFFFFRQIYNLYSGINNSIMEVYIMIATLLILDSILFIGMLFAMIVGMVFGIAVLKFVALIGLLMVLLVLVLLVLIAILINELDK